MEFLSNYWWAFGVTAVVFYTFVAFNQASRMKRMARANLDDGMFEGFLKGIGTLALAGVLAAVSSILFFVGLIIAIVEHFTN